MEIQETPQEVPRQEVPLALKDRPDRERLLALSESDRYPCENC